MMYRYLGTPFLILTITLSSPQSARADPVTFGSLLLGWLIGQTFTAGFQGITGRSNPWDFVRGEPPGVREMKQQLSQLAENDKVNAAAIFRLRDALNERMTKSEVEALIMTHLRQVDIKLAELAVRVKRVEEDAEKLRLENLVMRERMAKQEYRTDANTERLDAHEKILNDHERRIRDLERKVAMLGVEAFDFYRVGKFDKAITKLEEGAETDPGNPAIYYLKALALKAKGATVDASKAVKMGVAAEKRRAPGPWYRTVLERCQGVDRQWFEEERRSFLPIVSR